MKLSKPNNYKNTKKKTGYIAGILIAIYYFLSTFVVKHLSQIGEGLFVDQSNRGIYCSLH